MKQPLLKVMMTMMMTMKNDNDDGDDTPSFNDVEHIFWEFQDMYVLLAVL